MTAGESVGARRRSLSFWWWVAGAVVAALAAVVVAATVVVTPERARAFSQEVTSRALSREVRFASASLSLWPPFAVEVRGLEVSDPGGFARGTMLAARRVRLGLSLWALLGGTLRLEGVRVEAPRVRLWKDARGVGNWEGMGRPPAEAKPGAWNPAVVLRDFRLDRGGLAFYGPDRRPVFAVADLNLGLLSRGGQWQWDVRAGRLATYGPKPAGFGPIKLEGTARPGVSGAPMGFRVLGETGVLVIEGEGVVGPRSFELSKGRILRKGSRASVEDLSVRLAYDSVSVRLERLAGRAGRSPFEVSARLQPAPVRGLARAHVELADLAPFLPPEAGGTARGRVQLAVSFQGPSLDPQALDLEGTANLVGVAWQPQDPAAPPLTDLTGRVWFGGRAASVSGLAGRFGPVPFRASARIERPLALATALDAKRKPADPVATVRFDLAAGPIDVAKLFPPGKPLERAPALVAQGIVRAERLTAGRLDAREVVAEVSYDRGVAEIAGATAKVYGGSLTGSGSLDFRDMTKPVYDFSVQAEKLEAGSLLAAWTPFPNLLSGRIDLSLALGGRSFEPRAALLGLSAAGLARAVGGRVAGSRVVEQAMRWAGLGDGGSVDFRDLLWRFRIERGRVGLADTWIHTGAGDYAVGGSVGLDGSLAVEVSAVLPPERLAALPAKVRTAAGFFQDAQGRLLLDFTVGGTVKSPRFAWRGDRAAARFAERLQGELRGRAEPLRQAFEDSLASTRAAVEARLRAEADRGQKELGEAAARERARLEEKAKGWLGGFLGGAGGAGGAAPDTAARAPLALPPADTAVPPDTAARSDTAAPSP